MGPCSAETREQVMETARELSAFSCQFSVPFIYRAGVWKPRTRPETFQGVGEPALEWLQEVKRTYGVAVATEVATPEHVEAALKAGIDYLWIGARTSANPIAVQAIADRIKDGVKRLQDASLQVKGLLIKNPVNQDAELWLGNIARLEKAVYGVGCKVYAIHRGCGHQPCWSMAHKVRLARPDIPMLLDPSHMSGDASQVPVLMGKVAELGLDGAMIEVHARPSEALSDAFQQVKPNLLPEIIPFGVTRPLLDGFSRTPSRKYASERVSSPIEEAESNLHRAEIDELAWLRAEIDELDERLWDTIAARMDVSKRIGEWKKEHGVAALQPERYKEIVERIKDKGDFALLIWEIIHEESLKQQK